MDRRVVSAIVLMMAIAMLPAVMFKRPPAPPPGQDTVATAAPAPGPAVVAPGASTALTAAPDSAVPAVQPERVIPVTSPLFRYGVSTRGGGLVEASLEGFRSMNPADAGAASQIVPEGADLLTLRVIAGGDTLSIRDWDFTPSADRLTAGSGPLTLTASRGAVSVEVQYRFVPDNYLIAVRGRVTGLGPNGGTLLVGLGEGLRNTESDSVEHYREAAIVTKGLSESEKHALASLDAGVATTFPGPFEWVGVKSKYFVTALFAVDSLESGRSSGRISGVWARPHDGSERVPGADVQASLVLPAEGTFAYSLYAGPMEYPRLRGMGHDFYDVNPYGWPGFRTIIRPVAVAARWLLVKMHEFGISYGLALILFGILIRLALWPLNQKAMRASMQMQVVQPLLKEIQERHKDDPQRLQQEMFKLYKEYNVNPLGGCWPMLLPMPVLFALFFVFQNTIELRGAGFLWIDDLSRYDPLYVIPLVMGLSMYLVSKVGQLGMEPNPQMKIMLYMMPVMMTVLFAKFAAGLNLYYAVQNIASVPQQWLLAKERMKRNPAPAPVPPAPMKPAGKKK
ncbi:MAG: Membrane protein oxaA [Gemmatimonadetes bacterium]|nr:Membrane protein oxaA [Gemmatimonadota bacterium]